MFNPLRMFKVLRLMDLTELKSNKNCRLQPWWFSGWQFIYLFTYLLSDSTAPPTVRIVHSGLACNIEEERYSERVYTIREGETLELTCLVTGHPRPQVSPEPWNCGKLSDLSCKSEKKKSIYIYIYMFILDDLAKNVYVFVCVCMWNPYYMCNVG